MMMMEIHNEIDENFILHNQDNMIIMMNLPKMNETFGIW